MVCITEKTKTTITRLSVTLFVALACTVVVMLATSGLNSSPIPEYIAKVQVVAARYTDTGTGVYVADGVVVTAAHNIRDFKQGAELFVDGLSARVAYKHENEDFAILIVEGSSRVKPYPRLSYDLTGTLTTCGYVSGVTYTENTGKHKQGRWITAEVRQGMSGGPVLNEVGDVVGTIIGGGKGRDTYITNIALINQELRGRGFLD
jgi:S1-C subfamily serine protease